MVCGGLYTVSPTLAAIIGGLFFAGIGLTLLAECRNQEKKSKSDREANEFAAEWAAEREDGAR